MKGFELGSKNAFGISVPGKLSFHSKRTIMLPIRARGIKNSYEREFLTVSYKEQLFSLCDEIQNYFARYLIKIAIVMKKEKNKPDLN